MSLPLLTYEVSSQNQRVKGFEVAGDEQPRIYTIDDFPQGEEIDSLIWACYRQVFNEQQIIKFNRQKVLESQLKNGQITIRDFIKGLLLSEPFYRFYVETNSNYRLVEICVQRILGRYVYNEREKIAWSIVIATKGFKGFIDELLDSEEYLSCFGYQTIPYQRRRILPQRNVGELPNARIPRYDSYHLKQLQKSGQLRNYGLSVLDNSVSIYRKVILLVPAAAVALLIATITLVIVP
jgi:phycobilisome rod-core linker protein